MTYPKLPDGPNPHGAAGARALAGTSWQRKVGVDFTAHVKDGFARVTGSNPVKYLVAGTMKLARQAFGATGYTATFAPFAAGSGLNCDYGIRAFFFSAGLGSVNTTASYPGAYSTSSSSPVTFTIDNSYIGAYIGRSMASASSQANILYSAYQLNSSVLYLYASEPAFHYCGRVNKGQGSEPKLISVYNTDQGRVDSRGRKLLSPTFELVFGKSEAEQYLLPVTGEIDYGDMSLIASSARIYLLLHERFTRYGPTADNVVVTPKFWLYCSTDGGGTWATADIAGVALSDLDPLKQRVAEWAEGGGPGGSSGFFTPTTIPLVDGKPFITDTDTYSHVQDYTVSTGPTVLGTRDVHPFMFTDGYRYNGNMSYVNLAGEWVMCAGNVALYAFPYRKTVSGSYVWASKILRIHDTTATVAYTSDTTGTSTEYVQSMVYVGGTTVIAKKIDGFGGTNFDVKLMRSNDNGATWTTFTPTGFACPLKNQFFGNLFLDRAEATPPDAQKPPRILMTSWDAGTLTYHIFSSEDYGSTWQKRGKVGTPTEFHRIDTMVADDTGGNFDTISAAEALLRTRTIDIALPERYVRKPL